MAEQRKRAEPPAELIKAINPSPHPIAATPIVVTPAARPAKEIPIFRTYVDTWYLTGEINGNKRQTLHAKRTFATSRARALARCASTRSTPRRSASGPSDARCRPRCRDDQRRLDMLGAVLKLAAADKILAAIPVWERVQCDAAEVAHFEDDHVDALIDAAERIGEPMIDLATRTGLRIGELRALAWGDVDLVRGELTIRHSAALGKRDSTKTRNIKLLPLSPEALKLLTAYKATAPGTYLFPGERAARIWTNALTRAFDAVCATAKVQRPTNIKACNEWNLLRHSFANQMRQHVDPYVLSRLMRHGRGNGCLRTTQRYLHATTDDLRNAGRNADVGRRPVTSTADRAADPDADRVANPAAGRVRGA